MASSGVDEHQIYRTLEAIPRQSDLGKQVAHDEGKQVVHDDGKQKLVNSGEIEPVAKENFDAPEVVDDQIQHMRWREIALILAFGSVVILAAVVGGVLGSSRPSRPSWFPSIPPHRNIAALSFASNSVNNTRVYFQDDEGQIMEAAGSSNNIKWSIKGTGFSAKNESALAAAVSRPGFPLEISIFYLDVDNLIRDSIYNSSTGEWISGALSDQKYKAMPNSSLTAMYNQCRLCTNIKIIAFQDENGFVQVGNFTSAGWTLSPLYSTLEPSMGTGLALLPFYVNDLEHEVHLCYQKSNLSVSVAWWRPAVLIDAPDGWISGEHVYNTIPYGSPITAFSSYSNVTSGHEIWLELLFISNQGVQVNTWTGVIDTWLQQSASPSIMPNSTTTNQKQYESVAVTAIGNAFGVVKEYGKADKIKNWQVEDDMVNWRLVGSVDLGGLWKMSDI